MRIEGDSRARPLGACLPCPAPGPVRERARGRVPRPSTDLGREMTESRVFPLTVDARAERD
eukprot:2069744-Pyramimonas_sp.AAC.1